MIIAGHELEYIDDGHIYLVDGIIVPSVTQILKKRFGGMYSKVDPDTLNKAAQEGTMVHKAIEDYCTTGEESDLDELRGFKWLQKQLDFRVLRNEVPLILFEGERPIAAGRCDMVVEQDGRIGGADIKRVSALNKEYVGYQLNLYKRAYLQSYGVEWEFIWAMQLKGLKRKITALPLNDKATDELIKEYFDEQDSIDWQIDG